MTPTPEPGQPVWIAAEVVPSVAGHPMLTPITADGQPSAIRLAPARYRWQPADVPPQPPVLGGVDTYDAGHALAAAGRAFGKFLGLTLADVPGPDDTTPAGEGSEQ